jgi:hypothetical protein
MKRHFTIDDRESFSLESPDSRITRFTRWSIDLSAQAILDALTKAGLTTRDISGLVVNTCTGYICPGISTYYLIEKLALSRQTQVYDLVGGGCVSESPISLLIVLIIFPRLPAPYYPNTGTCHPRQLGSCSGSLWKEGLRKENGASSQRSGQAFPPTPSFSENQGADKCSVLDFF